MEQWPAKVRAAFRAFSHTSLRKKVKATPFGEKNGKVPYNASGVAQVSPSRFVFIDNRDPSAFFELALDTDGSQAERISRRPLVGVIEGQLRDLEGLSRVDLDGETLLIAASSLCVAGSEQSDGLVRVRYTPHGDLRAEAMNGFRDWFLSHVPSLAASAAREPDAGGLNIEGLAWDPRSGALLFGQRGPGHRERITVIRIPVDVAGSSWTTSSLGAPIVLHAAARSAKATLGIRDLSYDERSESFLILLGRSISHAKERFQLCMWSGGSDDVRQLDVAFRRSMKPEGITTFCDDDEMKILIVDDGGGYAVLDYRRTIGGLTDQ